MPIHIFTEAERTKLDTFPEEITHDDLFSNTSSLRALGERLAETLSSINS